VGSVTRFLTKTVTKTLEVFNLKEKIILVIMMVRLMTLVAAAMVMESTARMKKTHINIIQLHLMLFLGVIQQLHCGYNNYVTVILHNFICCFT
jgi:hypothetical protein